jgi:hypothetical protein
MEDELKNTWGMWYWCTMIWDAVGGIVMKGGIIYHQITLGWQSLAHLTLRAEIETSPNRTRVASSWQAKCCEGSSTIIFSDNKCGNGLPA